MSEPLEGRLVPSRPLVDSLSNIGYDVRGLGGQYRLCIKGDPNPVLFLSIDCSELILTRNKHPKSSDAMTDVIEVARRLGGTPQSAGTILNEAFEDLLPGNLGYRGTH